MELGSVVGRDGVRGARGRSDQANRATVGGFDGASLEQEAKTTGQLGRRLKILTCPSLLVIDEIGYLPVRQTPTVLDVYVIIELTGFAGRIPAI